MEAKNYLFLLISLFAITDIQAQPSNDACTNAINITPNSCNPISGTIFNATPSIPAINCNGTSSNAYDVWYKFVATSASHRIIVSPAANLDAVVDLRSGACTGTNIACADFGGGAGKPETINYTSFTIGNTYYIRIYASPGPIPSNPTFDIYVTTSPAIANDNCAGAIVITPNSSCVNTSGSIGGATASGFPKLSCDAYIVATPHLKDVWYKFTASNNGQYTVTVTPNNCTSYAGFDAVLGIYSSCGGSELNCADNGGGPGFSESITFSGSSGTTYFIRVYDYGLLEPTNPAFNICVTSTISSCTSPVATVNNASGSPNVTLNCNVTGGSGGTVLYKWYSGTTCSGTEIGYNSSYTTSSTGSYACKAYISLFESTCFSCDYGVATVTTPTNNIEGNVKDVSVNSQTKELQYVNFANCNIKAYFANTNTVASSTTSNTVGYFNITGLALGNYDIEVKDNSAMPDRVLIENVSLNTNIGNIKLPTTLLNQINTEKLLLTNLNPTISSIGSSLLTYSYDIYSQNNLLNQWKNIESDHDDVIQSAARLYVTNKVLREYYLNADQLNNEIATTIHEVFKSFYSVSSIISKINVDLVETSQLNQLLFRKVILELLDVFRDELVDELTNAFALTPTESFGLKLLIGAKLSELSETPYSAASFSFDVIKPIVESVAADYIINRDYIQGTQGHLELAVSNSNSLIYSGIFNDVYTTSNQLSIQSSVDADINSYEAELYRDYSGIIDNNVTYLNAGATIVAATSFAQIAAVLKSMAIGGTLWSYSYLIRSFVSSVNGYYDNKSELPNSLNNLYKIGGNGGNIQLNIAPSSLDTAISNYNYSLNQLKLALIGGDIYAVTQAYDYVTEKSKYFKSELRQALIPINLTAEYAYGTISNYDSVMTSILSNTITFQPRANYKFNLGCMSHILDNSDTQFKDSILAYVDTLIEKNLNIIPEINSIYTIINGMPVPNYLEVFENNLPNATIPNSLYPIKVKFKNNGPTDIFDLYVLVSIKTPFNSSADSIFVGNINANQIDSITFSIASPSVDTLSNYTIEFIASGIYSEGLFGAIKNRNRPILSSIYTDSLVCTGDTLHLYATSDAVDGNYFWSGPNGFQSEFKNPKIPNVSAINIGPYYCYVVSEGLSSDTIAVNVNAVNPLPTATISPGSPTSFCSGGSVMLNANTVSGLTYQWSKYGNNISAGNGGTASNYLASTTGSYKVNVTDANGCSKKSAPITVTAFPLPTATISPAGSTTICAGSAVLLNANSGAGYTYRWFKNSNVVATSGASFNATSAGKYKVEVTDSNGCIRKSAPVTVTVIGLPTASISASGTTTFCAGSSVSLNANTGAGLSYQWYKYSNPINGATASTYQATSAGSYKVQVTNSNGCSKKSNAIVVTVLSAPTATISPNTDTGFCSGDSVFLTTSTGAGYTYQWKRYGNSITGATSQSYYASIAGTYKVTVTSSNGCSKNSPTINVSGPPVANIVVNGPLNICPPDSVELVASTGTGYSYHWQKDINNIPGATNINYWAKDSGDYRVIITSAFACSDTSELTNLSMQCITTLFQKVYAISGADFYNNRMIYETADEGFVFVAYIGGFGSTICKTNNSGEVIWSYRYTAGGNSIYFTDVKQTGDGGYIAVGTTTLGVSNNDICVLKTDSNGISQWMKTYGTSVDDGLILVDSTGCSTGRSNKIILTNDGGYAISSVSKYFGKHAACVIKLNPSGVIEFVKSFKKDGNSNDYGIDIKQSNDSSYFLLVKTRNSGNEVGIYKINSLGNYLWCKRFNTLGVGGCNNFTGNLLINADSSIVFTTGSATAVAPYNIPYLVKLDMNGNYIWGKTFKSNSAYLDGCTATQTNGDGILLVGRGYNNLSEYRNFAIKTNSSGDVEWSKRFNEGFLGTSYNAIKTSDNGFAVLSYYFNPAFPSMYISISKTDSVGNSICVPINLIDTVTAFTVSPTNLNISGTIPMITNTPVISNISLTIAYDDICSPLKFSDSYGHSNIPNDGKLSIYPNPSTNVFTIEFESDVLTPIPIEIFSTDGKIIETIYSAPAGKGNHKAFFNAYKFSDGLYYCKVLLRNEKIIQKMVLIK